VNLFYKTVNTLVERRFSRIENFIERPFETQMVQFGRLIEKAKKTKWGKQYEYDSIASVKDFQEKVPLSLYEDLFPWIEKAMHGEKDVLWPGKVEWFSKSSGTTNDKSKYIPMSKDSIKDCHYKGGTDMLTIYIKNNPENKLAGGKTIGVGGSIDESPDLPGVKSGDLSAVLMKNLPSWAEFLRSPDIETATMSDWEVKLQKIAEATLDQDIRSIAGVPTWTALLIKKVIELSGKNNIKEVWPNLEVFFHGAVAFDPYREMFRQLIPGEMNYLELYNASEGFFAIQDDLSLPNEMLLMLDYGIFYEFIPMEVFGTPDQHVITIEQVEVGKNYALVISTNAGLWRYIIGDTVMFTSIKPHRIKVTGRTKHFINAFGEELMVGNADQALSEVCNKLGAVVSDYTAAPLYMDDEDTKGAHEWVIEFQEAPDDLLKFTELLDHKLRVLNSDYDAKRKGDMALGLPIVHIAPKGTFYKWMESRGKLGGQHKVPRLSNKRDYVESILNLL
jgi:hypothetical protein